MRATPRLTGALVELVQVGVLALVMFLVLHFTIQTVIVEGISMEQTLQDRDYLVATTIDYRLHAPSRGDIVVVSGLGPTDLIKRVIALPGERLLIRGGRVFINGRQLDEPYVAPVPWTINADWPVGTGGSGGSGEVMPAHEFFVMGDNRNDSRDSRSFGPVRQAQIDAHAWVRILPLNRVGPVVGRGPTLASVSRVGTAGRA
jgi:signal peptidase I